MKGEGPSRKRIEADRTESRREERARTVGDAQAKMDADAREKIRIDRLEARRMKLEHQDRETQDLINKQGQKPPKPKPQVPENKKKKEKPKAVIKSFKAVNESDSDIESQNNEGNISPLHKDSRPDLYDDEPTTQTAEPQEDSDTSIEIEIPGRAVYAEATDEEVETGSEEGRVVEEIRFWSDNDEDFEVPGPGPESEEDTEPEVQYEHEEEDESVESSPQREVTFKKTRTFARNQRRRNRMKIKRDQAEHRSLVDYLAQVKK